MMNKCNVRRVPNLIHVTAVIILLIYMNLLQLIPLMTRTADSLNIGLFPELRVSIHQ